MQSVKQIRYYQANPEIQDRRLTWYAALWDQPSQVYDWNPDYTGKIDYTEVVKRGCFVDSLRSNEEVSATIDHKPEQMFAQKTTGDLLLQEDAYGLFCTCYLPDNEIGNLVQQRVRSGELSGASFGFTARQKRWSDGNSKCDLVQASLWDVCLTDKPQYTQTLGEVQLRTNRLREIEELFLRMRIIKIRSRMNK